MLLAVLLLPASSFAQWSIKASIGAAHFVKMLDEVGQPNIGFIGKEGSGMLRSSDNGDTWTSVTFNPNENNEIFDISFKNASVGFAVGGNHIWKTTDGGFNWSPVSNMDGRAIQYIQSRNLVLMSSWTFGSQFSTDDGATWTTFSQPNMNGIAVLDDNRFLITPHQGIATFTTDGGGTWQGANMSVEAYQPVGLPLSGMYLAISEAHGQVMRSSDNGYSWTQLNPMFNPTGCVRGSDNNLIAQTMQGMRRSTDQGTTWQDICGPRRWWDTRFWVRGTEIFALDESGFLYYNPTSQATASGDKITLSPNPLTLYTDGCNNPVGNIQVSGTFCGAFLVSATVAGSMEFEIGGDLMLPYEFNSSVTVPVVYEPQGNDEDSAFINLRFNIGGIYIDTFVKVYGRRAPVISPMIDEKVELTMSAACELTFAQVGLRNLGCDPFTLDSIKISDNTNFELLGINMPQIVNGQEAITFSVSPRPPAMASMKLEATIFTWVSNAAGTRMLKTGVRFTRGGIVVKPLESKQFAFNTTCLPTDGSVSFKNPMCDTVFVDSVLISNTKQFALISASHVQALAKDQQMEIPFKVMAPRPGPASSRLTVFFRIMGKPMQQVTWLYATNRVEVVLPADTVKFIAEGTCPEFEAEFPITNIMCDSITILELKPVFQPQYTITLPQLPVRLAPNESTLIGVETGTFFKGVTSTKILVRYEAYGVIYDTVVFVSVRNIKSFSIDPKLSKVGFGRTSVCAPQRRTVYVKNEYCIPVSIEQLGWGNMSSDRFTIISQPTLPKPLAPGESDSIVLEFAPDAIGARSGRLNIKLKSALVTLDTFFTVDGIGTGNVNANINDAALAMGTALTCEKLQSETVVRNDGCVRLELESMYPSTKFKLISPTLPHSMMPGDSVRVVFEPLGNTPGAHQERITLRMLSEQGIEQLIDCDLSATIVKENERILAASLMLGELDGCKPFDTSITVTNPNRCDPVTVDASLSSVDATFIGPNSAVIPAGGSATFRFTIAPNTNAGITVRLRSNEVDTSVSVTYSFTATGGDMTLSGPTQELMTTACDPLETMVTVSTAGCKSGTIEMMQLIPSVGTASKFAFVNAYDYPIVLGISETMPVPVRFDPRAAGDTKATLRLTTPDGLVRDWQLEGEIAPVGTISAAITSAGANEIIVGDQFDVDLAMSSAGTSVSRAVRLEADFAFNSDLLTLEDVIPEAGWSLRSVSPYGGGAIVILDRNTADLPASEQAAKLRFRTSFARDAAGSVTLKSLKVNADDPDFRECVAETIFNETSNDVSVAYFCGAETLRDALNNETPIRNIKVRPHPTPSASGSMHVSFDLAHEAEVELELINVLGATHGTAQHRGHKGTNELQMPITNAAKGWYVLRLRTALGVSGIRVLITDQ
ncbi:MAG TPA: choice-of-anchor D domain-containing protein [Candidatus Kapabacteria bacterium]|nr:choice-of-anchor D domain-containing protein [Candidatus Kapabacteria bacterium]